MATKIISSIVDPETQEQESLEIDAVITQSVVDNQVVSKFPVEFGYSVSDNTFKNNKVLRITGLVSEATLRANQLSVTIDGLGQTIKEVSDIPTRNVLTVLGNELRNKIPDNIFTRNVLSQKVVTKKDVNHDVLTLRSDITKAKSFLATLYKNSSYVKVETDQEDFEGMIITNLTFDKKRPERGVLNFVMTLEQIRVVETQNITVPANLKPEVKEEGAGETNGGSNAGKNVPAAESNRLLPSALKALTARG